MCLFGDIGSKPSKSREICAMGVNIYAQHNYYTVFTLLIPLISTTFAAIHKQQV